MDGIDIWRVARPLLDQRGILAGDWALKRLMDLLGEHDIENDAIWKQALDAPGELQQVQPRDREMTR